MKKTYRIGLVLIALYGIYLNSGLPETFHPTMFLYYTILSNLICLLYFASIIIRGEKRINHTLKGAVTLCITVTFLVYHFLLVPTIIKGDTSYGTSAATIVVHYVVPIMVIVDWLVFDPKRTFRRFDPIKWLSIPLLYCAFAFVYGAVGPAFRYRLVTQDWSKYAYWFIDVDVLGWTRVLINVAGLTCVFLVLGYLYYTVDYALGARSSKK